MAPDDLGQGRFCLMPRFDIGFASLGMRTLLGGLSCLVIATSLLAAQHIPVPSGAAVYHQETLLDKRDTPAALRFRYVQLDLAQDADFFTVSEDLFALCQTHAVPNMGDNGAEVGQIIVSLANEETIFGETRPDVVQMFEVFTYTKGQCAWPEVLE